MKDTYFQVTNFSTQLPTFSFLLEQTYFSQTYADSLGLGPVTQPIAMDLNKWCYCGRYYHPLNCSGSEQTLVLHCITHSTAVALSKR